MCPLQFYRSHYSYTEIMSYETHGNASLIMVWTYRTLFLLINWTLQYQAAVIFLISIHAILSCRCKNKCLDFLVADKNVFRVSGFCHITKLVNLNEGQCHSLRQFGSLLSQQIIHVGTTSWLSLCSWASQILEKSFKWKKLTTGKKTNAATIGQVSYEITIDLNNHDSSCILYTLNNFISFT